MSLQTLTAFSLLEITKYSSQVSIQHENSLKEMQRKKSEEGEKEKESFVVQVREQGPFLVMPQHLYKRTQDMYSKYLHNGDHIPKSSNQFADMIRAKGNFENIQMHPTSIPI